MASKGVWVFSLWNVGITLGACYGYEWVSASVICVLMQLLENAKQI